MSSMTRVAIIGVGSINALGTGVPAFAAGLRRGEVAIGDLTLFPATGFRSSQAAEVKRLDAPATIDPDTWLRASRTAQLALVAATEAMETDRHESETATGVVLGTTTGGMQTGEECLRRSVTAPADRSDAAAWMETPLSVAADLLAYTFGCGGPRLTVATACSSGSNALGIAADWIRGGRTDRVLCGGADALCRMTFSGFNALHAMDREPCRPFDRDRAGLTLGEGAAMFLLEDWDRARARGARILGELLSHGVSADAHHLTQPRPDGQGAVRSMRRALEASRLPPEQIDYINAHGTGTPQNDVTEARAIRSVFGVRALRLPVSSTKSMIGHCLGGAGAIEALAGLLAIRDDFVPPTATLVNPDAACDLDHVAKIGRSQPIHTVLSNSYGFGGNNTTLIVRGADA